MKLDDVLQLQVLKLKALQSGRASSGLIDQILEQDESKAMVRNMCAKVSHQLYESLENVCNALDMSKREFIEAAVFEAVGKAEKLLAEHEASSQGDL